MKILEIFWKIYKVSKMEEFEGEATRQKICYFHKKVLMHLISLKWGRRAPLHLVEIFINEIFIQKYLSRNIHGRMRNDEFEVKCHANLFAPYGDMLVSSASGNVLREGKSRPTRGGLIRSSPPRRPVESPGSLEKVSKCFTENRWKLVNLKERKTPSTKISCVWPKNLLRLKTFWIYIRKSHWIIDF